ncbi:MAG: FAD-dependent oxidoreductase [Pseudomonadota bacterium]|nr:FAD-dependent oxidoreductase [Pseudomonadota bacterium]
MPSDRSDPASTAARQFEVVIVGGGAGGVELACKLGRSLGPPGRSRVLLVDRSARHIWKPTLHEVAAGTLDANQEGLSYLSLARRNHFSFALGTLQDLKASAHRLTLAELQDPSGELILPPRTIGWRWLVLATGSGSNFFGTPGAEEHTFVLECAADAERFRAELLIAFTKASYQPPRVLKLAVVGGGATGVELCAELRESHREWLQSVRPESAFGFELTIVEAADRILSYLPERLSAQAAKALRRQDVKLLTGTQVTAVRDGALVTSHGEVAADLIVWAAGIKAADHNAALGLEVNRKNQFVVDGQLQTSAPDVLAMGDCAACPWHEGQQVPARAQAAHQQADFLLQSLRQRLQGQDPGGACFEYRDFGSLVSLGENHGVGNLMGSLSGRDFFISGLLAKWMYMSLHLNHHRALLGIPGTAVLALARLLQRRVSGRVKLH